MKSIFTFNGKAYQVSDVIAALKQAGIKKGDSILVHSNVSSFGKLGDIRDREEFLSSLLDAFLAVLGDGTLIVPTYTYSFCKKETFDVKNSKSTVGTFSEFVRNHPSAVRSEDPIFSHAAIGKDAEKLLKKVGNVCFGEDSFFDRFYNMNGKIVNFGESFNITFLHYIERKFYIDYRFDKKFCGKIIKEDGKEEMREITFYTRYLPEDGKNVDYDMSKLENELKKRDLLKKVDMGNSFIICSEARDCFRVGMEMLKSNNYAFLKSDPNELVFESLPFYTGVLDSPQNNNLPNNLPFTLKFDKTKKLIVQKYSAETEKFLENAYKKGSLVSTNLGQGSFVVRRANDALSYILLALKGNVKGKSFLEAGCGDGHLLHRLKKNGAKRVLGCEPGPTALEGRRKYRVEIINDFYKEGIVEERFDCVFSYGVLEHILDPEKFINTQKSALNKKGVIFVAVPNCEMKLNLGDQSIIVHEHWNYFTRNSLKKLFERCGLNDIEIRIGMNNAIIYAWGVKGSKRREKMESSDSEKDLFHNFCIRLWKNRAMLKQKVKNLIDQGKTLGFYGGGLEMMDILPPGIQPRFFDGDVVKHGKYYPGCKNAIESPKNLLGNKVDELWITAIDYNEEIIDYLKNKIKISHETELVSIKEIIENTGVGGNMYDLVKKLFPICRSITGNGVRETLKIIQEYIPLKINEVPTGTKVFDWEVPKEWNIKDAYIKDSKGNKIVDFKKCNLHVVGYSVPIHKKMSLSELKPHLFTLPDKLDVIPYVTSYYKENWGFCLAHSVFELLKEDMYEVVIDSDLKNGHLTYGELYIPGKIKDEILFSTYICHPSMVNDNLSGPAILSFLAEFIVEAPRKYSYRFLFIPETIGAITWLSKNEKKLTKIKGGLVATCLGDPGQLTYKRSKIGNTLIDRAAEKVLVDSGQKYSIVDFFPLGSDERQFCSPGFNLPIGSLLRTLYGRFPEYHTSLDNLDFVKPEFLADSLERYKETVFVLESNKTYKNLNPKCEPRLGKRNLYSDISNAILWILSFSDGKNSLLDIATRANVPFVLVKKAADLLLDSKLIRDVS